MKKVAVFTEGQSELIFVRNFLFRIVDNTRLSFECIKLHGDREEKVRYQYKPPSPDFYFLIINVENDSRVISAIKERERTLFEKGFVEIIGLRDMYCDAYNRRSPRVIDEEVSREFINASNKVIQDMSNRKAITIFFSIMELESWFLSMYNIFKKINPSLSVDYIEKKLGYNLKNIDPQKKFYRPANEIGKILKLCGINYRKSEDNTEQITNKMEISDLKNAFENKRCESFKFFYQFIKCVSH